MIPDPITNELCEGATVFPAFRGIGDFANTEPSIAKGCGASPLAHLPILMSVTNHVKTCTF